MKVSHEVEFLLYGDDLQFIEIELEEGESVLADVNAVMYMDGNLNMHSSSRVGLKHKATTKKRFFKRKLMTKNELDLTLFSNTKKSKVKVAFAAPYPGIIVPFELSKLGHQLICQKDAFLCAVKDVSIFINADNSIPKCLYKKDHLLKKLVGDGTVFLHAGGTIIKKHLQLGETLKVDTRCLVAMSATIDYHIDLKTELNQDHLITLSGEGNVWLQSLPLSRMTKEIENHSSKDREEI